MRKISELGFKSSYKSHCELDIDLEILIWKLF